MRCELWTVILWYKLNPRVRCAFGNVSIPFSVSPFEFDFWIVSQIHLNPNPNTILWVWIQTSAIGREGCKVYSLTLSNKPWGPFTRKKTDEANVTCTREIVSYLMCGSKARCIGSTMIFLVKWSWFSSIVRDGKEKIKKRDWGDGIMTNRWNTFPTTLFILIIWCEMCKDYPDYRRRASNIILTVVKCAMGSR